MESTQQGIFQCMEQVLQGTPGIILYKNDILITGSTELEHMRSLSEILKHCTITGIIAKVNKGWPVHEDISHFFGKSDWQ